MTSVWPLCLRPISNRPPRTDPSLLWSRNPLLYNIFLVCIGFLDIFCNSYHNLCTCTIRFLYQDAMRNTRMGFKVLSIFFLVDLFKQQYLQFISYMKSPQYKVAIQQEIEREKVSDISSFWNLTSVVWKRHGLKNKGVIKFPSCFSKDNFNYGPKPCNLRSRYLDYRRRECHDSSREWKRYVWIF